MSNTFAITRVALRQYRSIATADVTLGKLLILVGPNGSGKSNFLDSLRLVSESLETSLDQALRNRGGVAEVRRRSTGHPTHFSIELTFEGDSGDLSDPRDSAQYSGKYGFRVAAEKGGGFRISSEACHIAVDGGAREFFKVLDGKLVEQSLPVMPPSSSQRLYLVSAAGLPQFLPVFDGFRGINVYNPNPDAIRLPQAPDAGEFLHRDGANLASVLHRLDRSTADKAVKNRIEEYVRLIVPGMRSVDREPLGQWETVTFSQDVPGAKHPWRFPAQSVSDGTLRALAVLTALFASSGHTLSPIGVEEPESALHPAAASILMDALRDASERRQVLATSHSADLLDRGGFQESELLAVRSVGGETIVSGLDPAGAKAIRESLYTPGELLRIDQLLPDEGALGA
jgi:predicted ATPase